MQERVGVEGIEIPRQHPLISGFCVDTAFNRLGSAKYAVVVLTWLRGCNGCNDSDCFRCFRVRVLQKWRIIDK